MVRNQAGWVAGENFIEVTPGRTAIPLRPLLAVLNAGTTEVAVRASAHVYGGGVYNLSPGSVGDVPVVDVRQLSPAALHQLEAPTDSSCRREGRTVLLSISLCWPR